MDEKPTAHYGVIGGLDKQIQELVEVVVLPVTHVQPIKALFWLRLLTPDGAPRRDGRPGEAHSEIRGGHRMQSLPQLSPGQNLDV